MHYFVIDPGDVWNYYHYPNRHYLDLETKWTQVTFHLYCDLYDLGQLVSHFYPFSVGVLRL